MMNSVNAANSRFNTMSNCNVMAVCVIDDRGGPFSSTGKGVLVDVGLAPGPDALVIAYAFLALVTVIVCGVLRRIFDERLISWSM